MTGFCRGFDELLAGVFGLSYPFRTESHFQPDRRGGSRTAPKTRRNPSGPEVICRRGKTSFCSGLVPLRRNPSGPEVICRRGKTSFCSGLVPLRRNPSGPEVICRRRGYLHLISLTYANSRNPSGPKVICRREAELMCMICGRVVTLPDRKSFSTRP